MSKMEMKLTKIVVGEYVQDAQKIKHALLQVIVLAEYALETSVKVISLACEMKFNLRFLL
jgi:hypothetical protein